MQISSKDKTLIKIAACVLLVLVAWLYGFNTFQEMADKLETENEMISNQIEVLSRLEGGYEPMSASFKEDANRLLEYFPADVREEDEILYADSLTEKVPGTRVYYVTTPPAETIEISVPNREDMLSAMVDRTGEMSMNNYQPDGSILPVGEFVLKKATAAISLQTDYNGLKTILNDIAHDENVKSVEDIALTFDSAGGVLNGAMNINFYALTGTGKTYTAPDAGQVRHGVTNIFGERGVSFMLPEAAGEGEESVEGETDISTSSMSGDEDAGTSTSSVSGDEDAGTSTSSVSADDTGETEASQEEDAAPEPVEGSADNTSGGTDASGR